MNREEIKDRAGKIAYWFSVGHYTGQPQELYNDIVKEFDRLTAEIDALKPKSMETMPVLKPVMLVYKTGEMATGEKLLDCSDLCIIESEYLENKTDDHADDWSMVYTGDGIIGWLPLEEKEG